MGDQLDRFGDIVKARAFGGDIYLVNNPGYAQHVLRRNWKNYKKGFAIKKVGQLLGKGLMVSEGDFWKTQRKLVQPAFHRSVVESAVAIMNAANRDLLGRWERAATRSDSVNVTRDTSTMALNTVLMSIFGADHESVEPSFRILTDEAARNLEFAQAFNMLRKPVVELLAERRTRDTASPDVLGMLMAMQAGDGVPTMTDSQLVNEVMTIIVAGHETTASTLNWTWYLLSQHRDQERRLHAEVDAAMAGTVASLEDLPKAPFTRQVIEEALRLYPAGWLMTRRALRDDQLGAYFVPAGTEIYISPYFMQRHPALWDEPDRFDPDRFSAARSRGRPELAMLAFSAGPRNCIGELFARLEMQIHVMAVAKRLRLTYAERRPPEFDVGVNLRSKHDFIMTPKFQPGAARGG